MATNLPRRATKAAVAWCQECGHAFRSTAAAERAAFGEDGCPGCGGADIDCVPPDAGDDRDMGGMRMAEVFGGGL